MQKFSKSVKQRLKFQVSLIERVLFATNQLPHESLKF